MPSTAKPATDPGKLNPYPLWSPRFWHGMQLGDWLKLASRHGWRIDPRCVPLTATVSLMAAVNSGLALLQRSMYGKQISQTPIEQPPLFIIGHWRSGTTMLHEILVRDDRFGYPTTYECFAANHYLVTGRVFPPLLSWLLPAKRPMDDMAISFDSPQEDEFALVSMGAPSPLLRTAFPNDPPPYLDFLDMEGTREADLENWKSCLRRFVQSQTLLKKKRLVLKSPTHTGRIETLSQLFPGAQFIHMVRDPLTLFPSNRRLWQALDEVQAFQVPHHRNLEDFVFTAFERMYQGFGKQRDNVPAGCLTEVRYEDLIREPVSELQRVYDELDLGDFAPMREQIQEYVAKKRNYRVNKHQLAAETEAEIARRWGDYQRQYGYDGSNGPASY